MVDCYEHFTAVAPVYTRLRTTDASPVKAIRDNLVKTDGLYVADIGCGSGRYSQQLFLHLGPAIKLVCVDVNRAMLDELNWAIDPAMDPSVESIQASANALPFDDGTLDVITTFNAIHHFDVAGFLRESRRVLKKDGKVFLYTRLMEQNATTIWGRFFPGFLEKETRLYTRSELSTYISRHLMPSQMLITPFSFYRQASLEALVEQAKLRHYSTFSLYGEKEFEYSLGEFERCVGQAYLNLGRVLWTESYTLFTLTR
ncbi:MAG: class I SAM-dependent methyltransferase [Chloroflexi bacterium]|nr:class I SAM-dependent methyltransferase [Chloroflexota bacterium]